MVCLSTGGLAGFESLVRWEHPTRGLLPPHEFVPAAEANGSIHALGQWVLTEACRFARGLHELDSSKILSVSVNLSAREVVHPGLTERFRRTLAEERVQGRMLRIEITESALLTDLTLAARTLNELRSMGPSVDLDDFGLGFSCLGYLRSLPVDGIKIDASFVSEMGSNRRSQAVVEGIVHLASRLEAVSFAEGVGSMVELEALKRLGCSFAQGFLLGAPVAAEQAREMVVGKDRLMEQAKPGIPAGPDSSARLLDIFLMRPERLMADRDGPQDRFDSLSP